MRKGRDGDEPTLELDSDQGFAEPVALSSTQPADCPLPRRVLRLGLDLVALRARRREQPKRSGRVGQVVSVTLGSMADQRTAPADPNFVAL